MPLLNGWRAIRCGALAATTVAGAWIATAALYMPQADIPWLSGERLFRQRCALCHSMDLDGGDLYGPNLAQLSQEAGSRVRGKSAEEYVVESIVDPGAFKVPGRADEMPPDVSAGLLPAQVVSLAAFLLSHGGSPDFRRLARMVSSIRVPRQEPQPDATLAALEEGRDLFFHKGTCINCHALRELPGSKLRAPGVESLRRNAAYIRESIRQPSKKLVAGYEDWRVWLVSGALRTGRLIRQDSDGIELLEETPDGPLVLGYVPMREIARDSSGTVQIRKSDISPMPADLPLSDSEIDSIILFLKIP